MDLISKAIFEGETFSNNIDMAVFLEKKSKNKIKTKNKATLN